MFRGNCPTRLDEKGRLKVPADFKHEIDREYDGRFYITSFDGKIAKLYPLKEWELLEKRIKEQPIPNHVKEKFLNHTSLYGQVVELDAQGRLTIAERLREKFGLKGEVAVIGKLEHIEIRVWDEFVSQVEANPLTPDDLDLLMQ
jgi:MraZ protein